MYKFTNKETGAQVSAMKFTKECLDNRCIVSIIFENFASTLPYTVDINGVFKLYSGIEVPEDYWIVKNNEGFYFPIMEKELLDKYHFMDGVKSHKYDTTLIATPFIHDGKFCEQIKKGNGSCEIKSFQLTDETLTNPIPSVMVDGVTEAMKEIAEKYGLPFNNI